MSEAQTGKSERQVLLRSVIDAQTEQEFRVALRCCASYARENHDRELIVWLDSLYALLHHLGSGWIERSDNRTER